LPGAPAAAAAVLLVLAVILMTKGAHPHYAAPVVTPLYALMGAGFCALHRRARRLRTVNFALIGLLQSIAIGGWHVARFAVSDPDPFALNRQRVEELVNAYGGRDLVIVDYSSSHNYHEEWVYNAASIDDAEIVWARSMGAERDARLRAYFADRTHWRLTVGSASEWQLNPVTDRNDPP
jgi:hypothetical protein